MISVEDYQKNRLTVCFEADSEKIIKIEFGCLFASCYLINIVLTEI